VKTPIQIYTHEAEIHAMLGENQRAVERLANVETIVFANVPLTYTHGARHTARFDVHVLYERRIDISAECERLRKELDRIEKVLASGRSRLENPTFRDKAPPDVVEGLRKQVQENELLREKTQNKRRELGCQ
jgi:valyl-tRNA synthetase